MLGWLLYLVIALLIESFMYSEQTKEILISFSQGLKIPY